ncbi:TPA: hypothetical protein RUZ39_000645 [Vibrio cholerae]|nr:hypothetical protein [Vibrio cholerae]
MMRTLPMIFNTDMVKALISGDKVVTRRPAKLSLRSVEQGVGFHNIVQVFRSKEPYLYTVVLDDDFDHNATFSVPCRTGDLIYVRETLYGLYSIQPESDYYNHSKHLTRDIEYVADKNQKPTTDLYCKAWLTVPSIHMPRWASRLTLKVTDVRIEKLNDLRKNEEQIKKEGFKNWPSFKHVWESIYGQSNPNDYVWVIEFEVIHQNVDKYLSSITTAACLTASNAKTQ